MTVIVSNIVKVLDTEIANFDSIVKDEDINGFSNKYKFNVCSALAKKYVLLIKDKIFNSTSATSDILNTYNFTEIYNKFKCLGIDLYDYIDFDISDKEKGEHHIFGSCNSENIIYVLGSSSFAIATNNSYLYYGK